MHHLYAHTDNLVNHGMRGRIGKIQMTDIPSIMSKILAANIKSLRQQLDLTQDEFADLMESSQSTINRWEKGADPKHPALLKMAELAGCSIQEFTTRIVIGQPQKPLFDPSAPVVMLPVQLPSEGDLTEMFEGLLGALGNETDQVSIAQRLAQLLPGALAQTIAQSRGTQARQVSSPAHEEDGHTRPEANPARPR